MKPVVVLGKHAWCRWNRCGPEARSRRAHHLHEGNGEGNKSGDWTVRALQLLVIGLCQVCKNGEKPSSLPVWISYHWPPRLMICFLERAGLRSRQAERIYQNRTGCNRLSLCIAWADGPVVSIRLDGGGATVGAPVQSWNSLCEPEGVV